MKNKLIFPKTALFKEAQIEKIRTRWSRIPLNLAVHSAQGLVVYPHLSVSEDSEHISSKYNYRLHKRESGTGRITDIILKPLVEAENYVLEGKINDFKALNVSDPSLERFLGNRDYHVAHVAVRKNKLNRFTPQLAAAGQNHK